MYYQTIDRFYSRAKDLRAVFDRRFRDPLETHSARFVWDYWHVPGQFSHLRTPAFQYFPKSVYEPFHRYLVRWGRENLGCHDISPPWLSCYIDGSFQNTHRDSPHGPLAFVYSLSPETFRGGETFIAKPRTKIAPKFNRLTLFNPDLAHGVRPVRGSMDPREGRLVIHGWFVQPRPFWTGPLQVDDVRDALDQLHIEGSGLGEGFLSTRLKITATGRVLGLQVLMDTRPAAKVPATRHLLAALKGLRFPARRGPSQLTLPLVIR